MAKKMNKEQIIEILKTNVGLYKDEPEFVEYIVNLAMYLIEYQKLDEGQKGKIDFSSFEPIEGFQKYLIDKKIRCHNCGKVYDNPGICPECGAFND